jgi:hypothetical protein
MSKSSLPKTLIFMLVLLAAFAGAAFAAKNKGTQLTKLNASKNAIKTADAAILKTANDYVTAVFNKNGTLGCMQMSKTAQEELLQDVEVYVTQPSSNPINSCAVGFVTLLENNTMPTNVTLVSTEKEIDTGKIVIKGNKATLTCKGIIPWSFIKQNNHWLIDQNILST